MSRVAVFGEALFDMIQQQDGSYHPFVGGSPFNVARGFVKQGIETKGFELCRFSRRGCWNYVGFRNYAGYYRIRYRKVFLRI